MAIDAREPVLSIPDLETLIESEIVEGYSDGLEGFPCGENRSRSYWHGWRNGMVDSGRQQKDDAQIILARMIVDYQRKGNQNDW